MNKYNISKKCKPEIYEKCRAFADSRRMPRLVFPPPRMVINPSKCYFTVILKGEKPTGKTQRCASITGYVQQARPFVPKGGQRRSFSGSVPPLKPSDRKENALSKMYRNKEIKVRLTEKELERLNRNVSKTKRPREEYIRHLINGYEPKELPPDEYYDFVRRLWEVHSELNRFSSAGDYSEIINRFGVILDEMMHVGSPAKKKKEERK